VPVCVPVCVQRTGRQRTGREVLPALRYLIIQNNKEMEGLDDLEEKLILERAQKGDKEAFAEIYDFYVVKIFRFIYLKTNSKETAEDLTSEVFLKSWKYIRESGRKKVRIDKIGSFLYKVARNTIIDFYRKRQNSVVEVEIDEERDGKIEDDRQDILAQINAKQEVEELMKALGQLKDEYQEVIILRYVEGLSTSQVAEITGKNEGALRVLLHRAVKSLEKVMKLRRKMREKAD